jgi:hypothetical protein
LEDEEIAGASTISCNKKHGNQDHDDVNTLSVIGKHRQKIDRWFNHEGPIYETNSEI